MTTANWAVRPGTHADIPELVRLKGLTLAEWPFPVDLDADPTWRERAAAEIGRQLEAGLLQPFVVDDPEHPGCLAGCILAALEHHIPGPFDSGRLGYLATMFTEPACRRHGLGAALLDAALGWCRE